MPLDRLFVGLPHGGKCAVCGLSVYETAYGKSIDPIGHVVTISPKLNAYRRYEVCMKCIKTVESFLEGRARIKSGKKKVGVGVHGQKSLLTQEHT